MDREYHLITPECRKLAAKFLPFSGEKFLVTFANKGLYKRALKDLEGVQEVIVAETDGALAVTLDGVAVTLREKLADSACACPSKTVCKHMVMAVLCAAEVARVTAADAPEPSSPIPVDEANPAAQPPESAEPPEEPFAALKNADPAALRKQAGKRLFDDALRLVQEGWTAVFTQGEMLAARIDTENVTVYFPREDSIARAVCKCGAQGLCRHKLIAILSYLGQANLPQAPESESGPLDRALLAMLGQADRFVVGMLDKGLVCAGETDAEAAIQLSIRLEAGAANLSRAFRRLATEMENLLEKNAAFRQEEAFALLSRLHNTLSLLLRHPGDGATAAKLLESGRSDYRPSPAGTFLGLGAYPWRTQSGFFGITALLWHEEKQRLCTYTSGMAGYYEKTAGFSTVESLRDQLSRPDHWQDCVTIAALSSHRFRLRNLRINAQGRVSSGKQTACSLDAPTCPADLAALPILADPERPPEPEPYAYFPRKRPEEALIVPAVSLAEVFFDRVEQTLRFFFCDAQGRRIPGALAFSELTEQAIRSLETLGRLRAFSLRYFVCLRRGAHLTPVSLVTEDGMENFYF